MHRDPTAAAAAVKLKIALVSPHPASLEVLKAMLEEWGGVREISLHAGGVELAARAVAEAAPDVLLVETARHDLAELAALELVTVRHPALAAILASPNHSADFLRQAMRIGVREVLPLPVPREALFEALGRVRQRAAPVPARRRARILSFVGCKGGSGATFIATNVAHLLAEQEGKKVALIDLNFQFGDAALYVTHRVPARTLADVADEAHRLDASLLANSMLQALPNFHILPAPEDPEQALRVRPESIDPLLEVAGSAYDVVIVDAGRTLDDVTVRAMDRSDAVYAVLQLNLPFLRDAKRLLRVLTSLGYGRDKVKLVVNRFHKRSTITLQDLQETLQHEVFRTLPNSFDAVTASVNQGVPIFKLASRDPVSRGLREIAGTLVEAKKEAGGWRRLLSR